ncbi:MAG: phage holin family protein [Chitinophagaceae bacterium]|nr:MAG: phage holin family protein [Chitinophagaceae bacterium]
MDDLKEKTADLADHVEDIADTFYRLTILNVIQKATNIASGAITMIVLTVLGLFVLLFLGIGLSWWFGDLIGSRTGGFLLGGAFFLLLLFIILLVRKKTIFPLIRNLIISKVYD